ncbi:hypothetical protein, variant 3 [Aphanomyces astaci]|uniref:Asparaginase n=1 Tax=Aphanomyces astaci TaxID=112090 RepID=W4GG88_APHAT|nr:hypothetical protein, variant 3 [Aphanomyces astaci]ETV78707.1 hypothetical protein, variant 3 [Aphanomyces astaci]|eukprot:XP_009831426.1 hypothetical protein, variant 3 [Aphanomyces astaci]
MWFVAVHIGAGNHESTNAAVDEANTCMRVALEAAARVLSAGGDAVSACEEAVVVLEDAECTNAGCNGPQVNLTTDGRVETDASVMSGSSNAIGCCGAVEGVRNPITLAVHLLRSQERRPQDRQPPLFLVGHGALAEAKDANLSTINYDDEPIHPRALIKHQDNATRYLLDTVGAICIDSAGHAAAAVSSAGIALKRPGRVGHAGCPRMGCCASNGSSTSAAYAFSCTGRGEHLVQGALLQHLERQVASMSAKAQVNDVINNAGVAIEGGVIGLIGRPSSNDATNKRPRLVDGLDFVVAFTTPSMGIGMLSSSDPAPHVRR